MELYLKFVQKEFSCVYEEKKSKFMAHLMPYENFDEVMTRLKKEHPKARHHVYAYRYLNDFEQIVENSSDDGEPKGTSGKPSLAVLGGAGIINTAVIIVRYFGGIKLGTGGLVRAYSTSVNEVLKLAEFIEYKKLEEKSFCCVYSDFSKVEYYLNKNNIKVLHKNFDKNITIDVNVSNKEWELLSKNLKSYLI